MRESVFIKTYKKEVRARKKAEEMKKILKTISHNFYCGKCIDSEIVDILNYIEKGK